MGTGQGSGYWLLVCLEGEPLLLNESAIEMTPS